MMNLSTRYRKIRNLMKIAKIILKLALLILEVLKRFKDFQALGRFHLAVNFCVSHGGFFETDS